MGVKKALATAGFASLAMGHSRHMKRGTVPADGTIWTSCVTPGVVALTFDDGPYIYTQSIVDALTAAGHRATFFQNGQNWDTITNYASTLQSMIAGGHQVASHTWSHTDLGLATVDKINSEMNLLEQAHLSLIGKAPTYMRPPYLSLSDLAVTTLKGLGFKIISIDIDTKDYEEGPAGHIADSISWYEGNQTAGGTLSLNHDPYPETAQDFVPAIIKYLDGKGLKSVPVGECIGDDEANWYKGGSASSVVSKSSTSTSFASGSSTKPPTSATPPAGSGSPGPKPSGSDVGGSKPSGSGPEKPTESGKGGDSGPGKPSGSGPDKPTESGKGGMGGGYGGSKPSGSGPDKPTESGKGGMGGGKPSGSGPDKPTESGKGGMGGGMGGSKPSGSGPSKPSESGTSSSSKGEGWGPACGGDTEQGHGPSSGAMGIPKHEGERNQPWGAPASPYVSSGKEAGAAASASGSPSYSDKPSSAGDKGAKASYTGAVYTGAASSFSSSLVLIGAAAVAAFIL